MDAGSTSRSLLEVAQAEKRKAAASAATQQREDSRFRWRMCFGLGAAFATWLAADYYFHTNTTYIMWRMRRRLLSGTMPPFAAPAPRVKLPPRQQTFLFPADKIMVLVGPSGCGKSALLAETARSLIKPPHTAVGVGDRPTPKVPTPCALISFPHSLRLGKSNSSGRMRTRLLRADWDAAERDAADLFDQTADHIVEQIGYPTRQPLVHSIFPWAFPSTVHRPAKALPVGRMDIDMPCTQTHALSAHQRDRIDMPCTQTHALSAHQRDRIETAMTLFFKVAARLGEERKGNSAIPPEAAAPVLMFDEPHDLIKDQRFARAGGSHLFRELCRHIAAYCNHAQLVRVVVTGSSAQLQTALKDTGLIPGARLASFQLQDPDEADTRAALEGRGYSPSDASAIVEACGARLRVLDGPLKGFLRPDTAAFLAAQELSALGQFRRLFAALRKSRDRDKDAAVNLLDRIEAAEAAPGLVAPPCAQDVTAALEDANVSPLIFIPAGEQLTFQSRVHRTVWRKHREDLIDGRGIMIVDAHTAVQPRTSVPTQPSTGSSSSISGSMSMA